MKISSKSLKEFTVIVFSFHLLSALTGLATMVWASLITEGFDVLFYILAAVFSLIIFAILYVIFKLIAGEMMGW